MEVFLSRHIDPMIQDAEIELTLDWFDLLPGNRHQHGVDMQFCNPRKNAICLSRRSRRGIPQLAAENQVWLSVDDQLSSMIELANFRRLDGACRQEAGEPACGEQQCADPGFQLRTSIGHCSVKKDEASRPRRRQPIFVRSDLNTD